MAKKEKKPQTGFRIDIVMPGGGLLYVKTVQKLNKERDVDAYRGQLHYGYAIRVTSRKTGNTMDMQCFRPKTPDNEIKAADTTSKYLAASCKRLANMPSAKPLKTKAEKRASSSVPSVPKKPSIIEKFKQFLMEQGAVISAEIDGFFDDLVQIRKMLSGMLLEHRERKARERHERINISAVDETPALPAPASEVIDLTPQEYKEIPEVEHIPGLPRVIYPQAANQGAAHAGSLLH